MRELLEDRRLPLTLIEQRIREIGHGASCLPRALGFGTGFFYLLPSLKAVQLVPVR